MKYLITILILILSPIIFPSQLENIEVEEDTFDPVVEEIEPTPEELLLEEMSLEQKVGQLFIFGFDGTTLSKELENFLKEYKPGGILLLKKNIVNENQLKKLISDIQTTNEIPLFISIDQEGGEVARIRWEEILTRSQSEIDSTKEAYDVAKSRGAMLKGYGINMNLAPVVEYITNSNSFMYDRVYRGSRGNIVNKSVSSVQGYIDAGILPVIKHYPGHSNESPDSHDYLPHVDISVSQWDEYIYPFSETLNKTEIDALMVGHIKYPEIDSNPATLSKEIITNRLIEDLSYEGLIISDDMEMGALDDTGDSKEIALKALNAGNDMLIYSKYNHPTTDLQIEVYEHILQQVQDNKLDIDSKVLKILQMKTKYKVLSISQ